MSTQTMTDSSQVPLADRRASPRARLSVEVSLESENNLFAGFAENVSEGGVFVATHALRPIGTVVAVELTLPGVAEPIVAECVVRWLRLYNEQSDSAPGMGLMFLDLAEEHQRALLAFVRNRPPLFWA